MRWPALLGTIAHAPPMATAAEPVPWLLTPKRMASGVSRGGVAEKRQAWPGSIHPNVPLEILGPAPGSLNGHVVLCKRGLWWDPRRDRGEEPRFPPLGSSARLTLLARSRD